MDKKPTDEQLLLMDEIQLTPFTSLPYPTAERRTRDKTWERCKVIKLCEDISQNVNVNYWVIITIFGDVKKANIEDVRFCSAV